MNDYPDQDGRRVLFMGRKIIIYATLLAVQVCAGPINAKEPALTVGAGARTCAQFARDYTADPELIETLYFTWAQGYLSGFARASGTKLDLMPSARGETWQKSYVREYCAKNPLSPFSEAAASLNLELIKFHVLQ